MLIMSSRLVCGVGINDSTSPVVKFISGKQVTCRFYMKWAAMLRRCYKEGSTNRNQSYKNCTVCKEWLTFSNFKSWMEKQDWQGKELDKDIIKPNNKVYCPEYCCFISRKLNSFLIDKPRFRGLYPRGVSLFKRDGNFAAHISINNKSTNLGYYATPEAASKAYISRKVEMIKEFIPYISDQRVINGLFVHIDNLKESK